MRISSKRTLLAGVLAAALAAINAQAGLTHRYSFTANGNDSIGGANATLMNGASITAMNSAAGNGVWFQNTSNNTTTLYKSGDGVNGQYVTLPTNVLAGAKNLTIEFWSELGDAISPVAGTWSRVYDFGDPYSAPGSGRNFIMYTPHSGGSPNDSHLEFNLNQTGVTTGSYATLESYHHVVNVFDCANGFIEVYIDGAKVGHAATTYQITNLVTKAMWLGRSEYTADDYLYGYLNEFRIYDRALSAPEILADSQVGADVINPDLTAQLGAVSAIAISDPGTVLERYTTNVAVTADFASAPGLSLFNAPGFTLTSSAPTVATVDGGGVIKALKPGTTTITATYGGKTATLSLTVSPDTIPPVITGADTAGYDRLVNLTFSKPLDPVTSQNVANYVLDGGAITVTSATLMTNNNLVVRLFTSPFNPNIPHTAVVNNVKDLDLAPNTIATDSTISFGQAAGAPLTYRLYFTTAGYKSDTLANGITNPGYPYTGGQVVYLANGLTDAGGRGDNYFSVINGWLVPPTSGQYTFGVATDDESTLYVSTDDTAASLPAVATLNCTGYATAKGYISGGTPPTRTGNSNVTFTAGNKYYFRLIHRNGTGGDNLDVTWQMPGGNPIANGDPAIPAKYLIPQVETNVALAFTKQPTNQTVLQSRPVNLSLSVVGVPTYTGIQWFKDGKAMTNGNGNATNVVFANVSPTNAGTYYAIMSNLVYTVQSSNVVLTVTSDTVAPTIVLASTRLGNNVDIQFSEVVDLASATNKANYVVKNGTTTLTITNITVDPTGTIVSLAVTPKIVGSFSVVINNVKDFAGNKIAANSGANGVVLGVTPGMISYWPLDTVVGTTTPDVVSGYDMNLVNLTAADLVPGHKGNAFMFSNARKTILQRVHGASDNLPIYKWPQFTISVWVNGPVATSPNDLRFFAETSSKNNSPMLNMGTRNASGSPYFCNYSRNDSGAITMDHVLSTIPIFDNTWHHVVWLQNSNLAPIQIYIDGVKDGGAWALPEYPLTVDTTAIGGIQRAAASAWFNGMVDDVAVWNRMLAPEEITELFVNGTPVPPPIPQPLAIGSFKSDLPAIGAGDSVTLRWSVSKDADKVVIDEIGDVTSRTVAGQGSAVITLNASKTYTITVTRGVETLSSQATVSVIGGVAAGWTLLDNFDRYNVGRLPLPWQNPAGSTVVDVNGNRMLSVNIGGDATGLDLIKLGLQVVEGQQTTLFTRFYLAQAGGAASIDELVGLSDKTVRGYADYINNMGPGITLTNQTGDLQAGTQNGFGSVLEIAPMTFAPQTPYNLWIDVENDTIALGDLVSIYVAQDGDENRTTLFQGYRSNRNPLDVDPVLGATASNLVNVVVGGNSGTSVVYFDDFYLSKSGYNATVPHAFGFTTPIVVSTTPPKLSGLMSGNNVVISYSKDQGTGYTLQSATSVTGTWNTVATPAVDSGTNSTVTVPASKTAEFFRLVK